MTDSSCSVALEANTYNRLTDFASAVGRPMADVASEAINRYLSEQQFERDWSLGPGDIHTAPIKEMLGFKDGNGGALSPKGGTKPPSTSSKEALSPAASAQPHQMSSVRQQSLVPLYIAEPIIGIVDGLLEGDHSVADILRKGNFGLGTLNGLDGEVVVLDGVAYHQGASGVKVLQGSERTPFMTVTMFDKHKCQQFELSAISDLPDLQRQVQSHFRSHNVVYAILIQGCMSYVKSRAVCKQEANVRLKEVADSQVVFEHSDDQGCLVGFWCPKFMGSSLSVPGFHWHWLSEDKQRGGHLLQVHMKENSTCYMQELHRAQVDLPFREDFLDSQLLTQQASADLAAAEQDTK